MAVRIANGAGFLGDSLSAPRRLVEGAQVDYLTLEYLAELTMSILARQREKQPEAGYANDFLEVLKDLLPALQSQPQLKLVTNAGGVNPLSCAKQAGRILSGASFGAARIGVVSGDDLLPQLAELQRGGHLLDPVTGKPLNGLPVEAYVSANAYLGAQRIAEALASDARIVITGRVADASLTVGPALHALGGEWDDYDRLAAFSVAGHLIECGAQVTGGYSTDWAQYDLIDVGYPIAEIEADGTTIITKLAGSGGAVNRRTVIEQLTYEIGDPQHYLTPDVDVDFTTVRVEDLGQDRVRVRGATGRAAPPTYKVSAARRDRQTATGELLVYGRDAIAKAHACTRLLRHRLGAAVELHEELLGTSAGVPFANPPAASPPEVVLRLTAVGDAQAFARELASLITSGPAGLAGYAAGRPSVRQQYCYEPMLVAKTQVTPVVEVRTASDWAN
jgi:hypothetical protein